VNVPGLSVEKPKKKKRKPARSKVPDFWELKRQNSREKKKKKNVLERPAARRATSGIQGENPRKIEVFLRRSTEKRKNEGEGVKNGTESPGPPAHSGNQVENQGTLGTKMGNSGKKHRELMNRVKRELKDSQKGIEQEERIQRRWV